MSRLTLLVPSLFWPDPHDARPVAGLGLPALERLLGRGRRSALRESADTWILSAFGLGHADAPALAATSLLGLGHDPGDHPWLRADPVHLQPRGTELFLSCFAPGEVEEAEAAALLETLNGFFAADGLQFQAVRPDAWFARLAEPVHLATLCTASAHGRSVDALLPAGQEARPWRRRLNEAQMLLHEHPVNEARERKGKVPVNSLWFWGGGRLPRTASPAATRIAAQDPMLTGLARAAGAGAGGVPEGGLTALGLGPGEHALVVWEAAAEAAAAADAHGWRTSLATLDAAWIAPALEALAAGRLSSLRLAGFAGRQGMEVALDRALAWRFWRRPLPLSKVHPLP